MKRMSIQRRNPWVCRPLYEEKPMTHHVTSMLDTYPKDLGGVDKEKLAQCIQACFECAQT